MVGWFNFVWEAFSSCGDSRSVGIIAQVRTATVMSRIESARIWDHERHEGFIWMSMSPHLTPDSDNYWTDCRAAWWCQNRITASWLDLWLPLLPSLAPTPTPQPIFEIWLSDSSNSITTGKLHASVTEKAEGGSSHENELRNSQGLQYKSFSLSYQA